MADKIVDNSSMMDIKDFISIKQHDNNDTQYSPKSNEVLMPVSDYANKVGLTVTAVRAQLNSGRLDGIKMGRHWRVKVRDETAESYSKIALLEAENKILRAKLEIIASILSEKY